MSNKIYLIGAGGHARSLINLLKQNNYKIVGILDDSFNKQKTEIIEGIKIIGKIKDIKKGANIALSIGDNKKRGRYFSHYKNYVVKNNLIHKQAFLEKNIDIGISNQIFANSYINSGVKIGNNNIINTGTTLEHEVQIGSHNHISVGSILCGRVNLGNKCFIGAGAVIIDRLNICNNVIVGANSVVIKNINKPGTYVGNPARKIK